MCMRCACGVHAVCMRCACGVYAVVWWGRQAKAGLIWIIGQYAERIENSQVLPPCRACV